LSITYLAIYFGAGEIIVIFIIFLNIPTNMELSIAELMQNFNKLILR
jgi:hypothetical protein